MPTQHARGAVRARRFIEGLEARRLFSTTPVGLNPDAVATGDFNGDGRTDMAVADYHGNDVAVLLGRGDGTFAAAASLPVGTGPVAVVASDFSQDGKLDLAVTNADSNNVSVLIGHGDGTFGAATNFSLGSVTKPSGLAVGDFDNNGTPDLVTVGQTSNSVAVLLDFGGYFQPALVTTIGPNPTSVAVADVNGDGRADLAVTCKTGNEVSLVLGAGNGTFGSGSFITTGAQPVSVTAGDFNGDGHVDLATANAGGNTVSVLDNSGNGTFAAPISVPAGSAPDAIVSGDLNGDGRLDLAVADLQGGLTVLTNTASGFAATGTLTAGAQPNGLATADFDGDGRLDLAAANSADNTVSVVLGTGGSPLTYAPVSTVSVRAGAIDVVSADFNGDGEIDLASANASNGSVTVRLNYGYGTTGSVAAYAVGSFPSALCVGDFNGDGHPDLAVANTSGGTISILLNDGTGLFKAGPTVTVGTAGVSTGDINGDGRADLVVPNGKTTGGAVSVLLGNGDGTFGAPASFAVGSVPRGAVGIGDFNGDGRSDLAVANYLGHTISVLLNNGAGGFTASATVAAGAHPYEVVTGDFNNDGKTDLAAPDYGGGVVNVLLGAGNGTFSAATAYTAGASPAAVVAADLDGDGNTDLAVANGGGSGNTVSLLRGSGTGTFTNVATDYVGADPMGITAGDFNADGRLDLATADYGTSGTGDTLGMLLSPGGGNTFAGEYRGVLTISGTTSPVAVSEAGGVLTVRAGGITRRLAAGAARFVTITGVTATINSDLGSPGSASKPYVIVNTDATATINASQHLGLLAVAGNATLSPGGLVLRADEFNVPAGGRLDMTDGAIIYDYGAGPARQVSLLGLINAGYANGAWTGPGLTSTTAKNTPGTALGYVESSDYIAATGNTTFVGEPIDNASVLVRYTLAGDTNLDRSVTIADFNRLASGFNTTGYWGNGDFNYDGQTTIADFNQLAANFNLRLTTNNAVAGSNAGVTLAPPTSVATASLTGYAFDDANGDGKFDSHDVYTAGKRVFLDLDGDGVWDKNEPSTLTDKNGRFVFTGLAAGTYHVRRVFAKGYTYSTKKPDVTLATGQARTGLLLGTKKA